MTSPPKTWPLHSGSLGERSNPLALSRARERASALLLCSVPTFCQHSYDLTFTGRWPSPSLAFPVADPLRRSYGEEETEESMRARLGSIAPDQPVDALMNEGWRDLAGGWHRGTTETPLKRVDTPLERRKARRKKKKLEKFRGDLRRGRAQSVERDQAVAYHTQGNTHQARGENAKALELWQISLSMFNDMGMDRSVEAAYNLNNMATVSSARASCRTAGTLN